MTLYATSKDAISSALNQALSNYKIAALIKNQDRTLYDYIQEVKDIVWEYKPTVLSLKKFLFPQDETLLEYTADGKVFPKIETKFQILFGIRPCDIHGMKILDEAFAEGHGDPNYLSRREKTLVIGIDCYKECDEHAFCYRVKSNEASEGFDLMLYENKGGFLIECKTEKGKAFLDKYLTAELADEKVLEKYKAKKTEGFKNKTPFKDLDKLPEIYENNKEHEVWKEEASRCLSCGSCIMVCPTCYCFDVADELALNLKKGERIRRWDACMLSSFAVVAGGENFRPKAIERLKHRIQRKFNYLMKKHSEAVCVGCGRCIRACLADISPKKITETLTGEGE